MLAQPSISIVIPMYNESARVDLMLQGLREFVDQWQNDTEIILVDDGSDDDTITTIKSHSAYKQLAETISILSQSNTGKGGALKLGVSRASKEYTLTIDADMACSPLVLIHWLALKSRFYAKEVLIGSREHVDSDVLDSPKRKVVGNVFNKIIRLVTGMHYRDTQCGCKLYPTPVAKDLFVALRTMGWAHDVELLLRANRLGCAIVEMPIVWRAVPGSKINVWKDSLLMFWEVIRIRFLINTSI